MSTEVKTTQTLGIKINESGNYGFDPVLLASTEYYKLGTFYQPFGDFVSDQRELHLDMTGAKRSPNAVTVAKYHSSGGILTTAVNALPFYLAMGKYTSDAVSQSPNKNQIDFQPFGSLLPEFVVRQEDYNNTVGMYDSQVGHYIQNLNASLDMRQRSSLLAYGITTQGQRRVAPKFAGASNAGKLVYPGSVEDEYKFDNNTILNIGGTFSGGEYSSGGEEIQDEILDISLMINNDLKPITPNGQLYPKKFTFGYQIPAFSLTLHRIRNQALYDSFNAMADGSTTENFYFKIYQNSTDYMEWHIEGFNTPTLRRPHVPTLKNTHDISVTGNMSGLRVIEYSTGLDGDTYYV